MGSLLVKGLSLFLQLAESNPADKETTLDLVEVLDGRRRWWPGTQAALRVEEIRQELSSQGTSVLAQLARHWVAALREARLEGLNIPGLLVDLVQEELDPRLLQEAEQWEELNMQVPHFGTSEFQGTVRSLSDRPGMQRNVDRWLESVDFYEATQDDPLTQAWDGLPEETKGTFPPLELRHTTPGSVGVLEERMERLRRIAAVFLRDEKTLLKVLMRL